MSKIWVGQKIGTAEIVEMFSDGLAKIEDRGFVYFVPCWILERAALEREPRMIGSEYEQGFRRGYAQGSTDVIERVREQISAAAASRPIVIKVSSEEMEKIREVLDVENIQTDGD